MIFYGRSIQSFWGSVREHLPRSFAGRMRIFTHRRCSGIQPNPQKNSAVLRLEPRAIPRGWPFLITAVDIQSRADELSFEVSRKPNP